MPEIDEKAYDILVGFAERNDWINAVYEGVDPEEDFRVVYLLTGNRGFNWEMEDEITDLDLRINDESDYRCSLLQWPIGEDQVGEYGFIKDKIWSRS